MQQVRDIPELRARVREWKRSGERVGFVPTMGYLHEGHLSLVRLARAHAERVVVSIFVNPSQFNERKDFESYPVDLARDGALLDSAGCDLLFVPDAGQIYGRGYLEGRSAFQSWVTVERLTAPLEGACRPGHFRGVTTVVAALFNIVQPDAAVFGEKDFQQLRVIERMCEDLHFPVRIVRGPLVREHDGLAMSSRNVRLSPEARETALAISKALREVRSRFDAGERSAAALERTARSVLCAAPGLEVEYAQAASESDVAPLETVDRPARFLVAARSGGVRLIDNVALGGPELPES